MPGINLQTAHVRSLLLKAVLRKFIDYPNIRLSHFIHDSIGLYFLGSKPNQLSQLMYSLSETDLLTALTQRLDQLDIDTASEAKRYPRVEKK